VKRWIGLLFVSLLLGTGLFLSVPPEKEGSAVGSTPYTFSVLVSYDDTGLPVANAEVKLTDLTTGASSTKNTDSAGMVSFTPAVDLSSYSDGDMLEVELLNPPSGYLPCRLPLIGDPAFSGVVMTAKFFKRSVEATYVVGHLGFLGVNNNVNPPTAVVRFISFKEPDTQSDLPNYYGATMSTSVSTANAPSGATKVTVTYRFKAVDSNNNVIASSNPVVATYPVGTGVDPLLTVYINSQHSGKTITFEMSIDYVFKDCSDNVLLTGSTGTYTNQWDMPSK